MPQLIVTYWRDIPAQVTVKQGRKKTSRPLPERFEQAIDRAAMKSGAAETDDYLAEWRRGEPVEVEGDPAELAEQAAARIDAEYDKDRLIALINADGRAQA